MSKMVKIQAHPADGTKKPTPAMRTMTTSTPSECTDDHAELTGDTPSAVRNVNRLSVDASTGAAYPRRESLS
jgi:hypothetical protein